MLDIELLPKQWEVFESSKGIDYDIALYQGGVGSGKTYLGTLTGLSVVASNPGSTWLVGADSWSRLAITTWETYLELLDGASIVHKVNKSDHIIKIPGWDNGRILFKGVDDPTSLRSVNGIGGHLEEASLISEAAYQEFLGRLRQAKAGDPIRVILTTNPQTVKGWLFEHFVLNAGVVIRKIRGNDITINRRRVIARTLDNPYVSDAFIGTLEDSYDAELYKIMVLGEDGDYTQGLVCKSWSDANISDAVEYRPEQRLYITCDFNVNPMSWALAHQVNREYQFFDEIVLENSTTIPTVEEFYKRYPDHERPIILTGDASGDNRGTLARNALETNYTQMLKRLSELGYRNVSIDIREANPAVIARTAAWNSMVCNSAGVRRVKVHPRCKWLIWNCQNLHYRAKSDGGTIWEPTENDIKKDPKAKFTKHIWDAASYLIERYDPIEIEMHDEPALDIKVEHFRPHGRF